MSNYITRLLNERKDIKKKIDNINRIIESSLGSRDYFIRKHKYFWKIYELNNQLKRINKKLNFIMTLKAYMEGKNEEQIIKSNINK